MSNGLSNRDSGHRSRGGKKPPPPPPFDDAADGEPFDSDLAPEPEEELPEAALDAEADVVASDALEDQAPAESEPAPVSRSKHALRLIEARLEEKRLKALLKEVYDED
jgi:hypothetical protein